MANPTISKITLPSGTTYDIKDAGARELIEALNNYTAFLGVTTTALSDGATTTPITVNGSSVTPTAGCIATYGSAEFVFNGTAWQEFGDLSALGALAYKSSASGSVTAAGSVSQPTFTGTAVSFTPAGSVSTPTITVSPKTTTVNSITAVGTLPSLSATVTDETLTLAFDAGTLPTKGSNTTVVTSATATSSAPTFTGTEGSITAKGTVSKPTFTGSSVGVTVS